MALVFEQLKVCGVKINASICNVPSIGSGIVYVTPNYCNYNYVLTAKHIFQEDSQTAFNIENVSNIDIYYFEASMFKRLQFIKRDEIENNLLVFDEDFAIIKISKNENIPFQQILVSDKLDEEDLEFSSWATFSANLDQLHRFNFKRDDPSMKRFKCTDNVSGEYLPGMSGAAIFARERNIMCGVIYKYPNTNFENSAIDCTRISFLEINRILKAKKWIELDTELSKHKREINRQIIDIHQAFISEVCLDLELARKRLSTDISDDWYYDPLKYIDLLNQDYLFKQFEPFFNKKVYAANKAEQFFVPKKQLTLRQALVSPFIDRIMYMAIVGVLAESLDNAMIPNVYSARYNKFSQNQLIINGVEQWKKMNYKLAECVELKNATGDFFMDV